jgi:hypothetical protein
MGHLSFCASRPVLQARELVVLRFPVLRGRLAGLNFDRLQADVDVFSVVADAAASQVVVVGTDAAVQRVNPLCMCVGPKSDVHYMRAFCVGGIGFSVFLPRLHFACVCMHTCVSWGSGSPSATCD